MFRGAQRAESANSNKKSQTSTIERNWADGAEDAVCADQRGGDYYDAEGKGGGGGGGGSRLADVYRVWVSGIGCLVEFEGQKRA
jgi:hypothetical protein